MSCPDENTLVAFAHRLLDVAPATAVEVHLRACTECRQVVALLVESGSTPEGQGVADPAATPDLASTSPVLPERLLPPGTHVGRYVLLEPLGVGAMGVVYAAYDPELTRTVALKLLRRAQESSIEARARLQREARVMARMTSPYVLPVHDVGTWHEQVFVAMERVEGGTLSQWLAEKPRPWREILRLFLDAGRGLAAAHAAGLVHRDFKPDNVLVGNDGRIRVTDFGLALYMEGAEAPPEAGGDARTAPVLPELARQGVQVGTPAYMSPEQRAGQPVDARSDQFSFCVALYEGLHGERPPVASQEPVESSSPERARVPSWLRRVLLRGLSSEPQARFASMEELLRALEAGPGMHRRWSLAAQATVGVLMAVGLFHQLGARTAPCHGAERKLASVWDGSVRHAAEQSFLGTGRPFAAGVWGDVAASLDSYAKEWVGAHVEACEATRLRGEQSEQVLDLRMACLERRRMDLGALTQQLREADAELLQRALQATRELPSVAGCANVEILRGHPQLPEREPQRSQAEALRQRLSEVRALTETARYARGLELARQTLEEARALSFAPLEAEALLRAGLLEYRVGRAEVGKRMLLDAALAAHAVSLPELAAEGYLALTEAESEQPEEAQRWARFASACIHASGDEPRLRARLSQSEAHLLEERVTRFGFDPVRAPGSREGSQRADGRRPHAP